MQRFNYDTLFPACLKVLTGRGGLPTDEPFDEYTLTNCAAAGSFNITVTRKGYSLTIDLRSCGILSITEPNVNDAVDSDRFRIVTNLYDRFNRVIVQQVVENLTNEEAIERATRILVGTVISEDSLNTQIQKVISTYESHMPLNTWLNKDQVLETLNGVRLTILETLVDMAMNASVNMEELTCTIVADSITMPNRMPRKLSIVITVSGKSQHLPPYVLKRALWTTPFTDYLSG